MIKSQRVDFSNFPQKLNNFVNCLQKHAPCLVATYLFGSTAAGRQKTLSDIDIAVLFTGNIDCRLMETDILLSAMNTFGTEEIDLVILNDAPLHIKYGVLKNKKVIFCSDDKKRIDFEHGTIMEYLDFVRIRRDYDREFLKRVGVGS